jgi:hypothetical protein
MRLDNSSGSQIQRLNRLLPVSHCRTHHPLFLCHHHLRETSRNRLQLALRETHTYQRTTELQQLHTTSIRPIRRRQHQHSLSPQTSSERLHISSHVFGGGVIDEVFGAGLEHQVFLAAVVDADDAHAHAAGTHLSGDVAEAAAGAEEDDEVAGLGGGFAEGRVDCYACAEP